VAASWLANKSLASLPSRLIDPLFLFCLLLFLDISTRSTVDTVMVRISVLDENDHKPYFSKLHHKQLITTQPERGTEVAMVMAADGDAGKNKELKYFLVSGSGGFFRVNPR